MTMCEVKWAMRSFVIHALWLFKWLCLVLYDNSYYCDLLFILCQSSLFLTYGCNAPCTCQSKLFVTFILHSEVSIIALSSYKLFPLAGKVNLLVLCKANWLLLLVCDLFFIDSLSVNSEWWPNNIDLCFYCSCCSSVVQTSSVVFLLGTQWESCVTWNSFAWLKFCYRFD